MNTENPFAPSRVRLAAVTEAIRGSLPVAYGLATGALEFTPKRGAISEVAETVLAGELRAAHDYAIKYMLDKYAWIEVARWAIRILGSESGWQARAEAAEAENRRLSLGLSESGGRNIDLRTRLEASEASQRSADNVIRAVLLALGCGMDADPVIKVREMMTHAIATQLSAEAAEAKAAAVRDLHAMTVQKGWRPGTTEVVCSECVVAWSGDHEQASWPCPTITALDGGA